MDGAPRGGVNVHFHFICGMSQNNDDIEARAQKIYSKLQGDVPDVFKHPETFNAGMTKLNLNDDPHKLIYRTTNGDYGNFTPSLVEMPTIYKGKANNFVK